MPSATQFTTATKAGDLYNEVTGVTPANITAAATAVAKQPTVVVDADGEVITGYIFADNYFELYVNGTLIAVDPVPYTPFNSCAVKFKAKRPITYAIKVVDWEENLGLGTELNGGNPHYAGDGGLMASFSDGTVTNDQWKAQSFNIAPLDVVSQVTELANGTHDSSAATTHTLTETAYALHYAVPSDWYSRTFTDSVWPAATTYTEVIVGVTNKPAYSNFPAQFSTSGAQFIWSSNLVLDNEVIVRYTGPAAVTQIVVEQAATTLTDGASTVTFGSINVGSSISKTFTIRNNGSTALDITGVTIDGTNASNFTVTASPASSIAAGASTTMNVQFNATTAGNKVAALHIARSDISVGAAFDINLTGAGSIPAPAITSVPTTPTVPSDTNTPYITATITPAASATISSAQLTYSTGAQIPAQTSGTTVSYSIAATDSNGSTTTIAPAGSYTTRATPLNIVFIVTDDQGWGDVSYHTAAGQVAVQTPNMERIGNEGIRLEKFYATAVCATTRACLLTGRNTLRTNAANQRGLGLAEHLMPQTFKAAGHSRQAKA